MWIKAVNKLVNLNTVEMIYVEHSSTTSYVIAKTSNSRIVLKECSVKTADKELKRLEKLLVGDTKVE